MTILKFLYMAGFSNSLAGRVNSMKISSNNNCVDRRLAIPKPLRFDRQAVITSVAISQQ
ncbi:hypothetical protein [Thalassoporum mexicanum]|uniref:hypothetical protein n=1 Tax=Thalassoporum mexicanum TaxID=3457544 RepID=UPI000319A03C|nr:hypothetical protein [Pseudanabaena sp. PCC 7367]